jgi:hypothetical protein
MNQEIQLNDGRRFEIMDNGVPMTEEMVRSVISSLEASQNIQTLAYETKDSKSCTATVLATLTGALTITACPQSNVPGTTVTVGATATNTGNVANNSFVIGITATRSDSPYNVIINNNSLNLTLAPGETSAPYTLSFTMPGVNVNIAYSLKADPDHNY